MGASLNGFSPGVRLAMRSRARSFLETPALIQKKLIQGNFHECSILDSPAFALSGDSLGNPRGAFMDTRLPKILCVLCGRPVDFSFDLSADEHGKAVHTDCYIDRIISRPNNQRKRALYRHSHSGRLFGDAFKFPTVFLE